MRLLATSSYALSLALSFSTQYISTISFLTSATTFSSPDVLTTTKTTTLLSPQILYSKGIAELSAGEFQTALEDFTNAIEIAEKSGPFSYGADRMSDLHVSRGIAFEKLERWDDAINEYTISNNIFKKANFLSKDDPVSISNIANTYAGKLQWEEALKGFTYAAQLNPKYLAPAIGRALVLYQLDRKEESMSYFSQLVQTYPEYADGLAALAVMYNERGRTDEAADAWDQAMQLDSRYIDIDWVRSVRRWPPQLVNDLITFRNKMKLQG